MGVHQHPNSGWSKLKEWSSVAAGGIGMIKSGLDVGRAVYGVASAAAPYVLPGDGSSRSCGSVTHEQGGRWGTK